MTTKPMAITKLDIVQQMSEVWLRARRVKVLSQLLWDADAEYVEGVADVSRQDVATVYVEVLEIEAPALFAEVDKLNKMLQRVSADLPREPLDTVGLLKLGREVCAGTTKPTGRARRNAA